MRWTTPTFDEIRMDSEIGAYQEERDPREEPPLAGEEKAVTAP
jgi:hypothetical protein